MKMVNVIITPPWAGPGVASVLHFYALQLRACLDQGSGVLAVRRLPNKNPESFGVNSHHV